MPTLRIHDGGVVFAMKSPLVGSFELFSPLARDACSGRLKAMTLYPTSPLIGWVDQDSFRICCRTKGVRNSFRPYLFGRMRDVDGGTRMSCHFSMHPLVLAFCGFWLFVVIVAAFMTPDWPFVIVFLAVFMLVVAAGYAISLPERELILDQLKYSIGTYPV